MMFRSCSYEKEVAEALKSGHWPDGCGRELRGHVETCGSCSDFVLVTEAFQRARTESVSSQESLPTSPGFLWWRAQLRSRNEAAKKISTPITIAQIFAWLVTLLSMAILVASQYRHGLRWEGWWSELAPSHAFHAASLAAERFDWSFLLLAPSLGALVLLSGVVVYLASAKQ
jgi:hypothetical protein